MRPLRNLLKRNLKRLFESGQRVGVDILPRHFYSSIPDFRELRSTDDWRKPYDMIGVAGTDLSEQASRLREWMSVSTRERLSHKDVWSTACQINGETGYGPADADALFGMIIANKPANILQIGCGVSTFVILEAAKFAQHMVKITCVDPYPTPGLKRAAAAGEITLIEQKAQHVYPEQLAALSAGDLFFVDSSHTTKPGSDVHHVIFRALPRLPAGVWVHFHDINFPYDFGPNIFGASDLFFGSESTLLHAYLINNAHCQIAVSLSMLQHGSSAALKELLPSYTPVQTDRGINPPESEGRTPSATYLLTS